MLVCVWIKDQGGTGIIQKQEAERLNACGDTDNLLDPRISVIEIALCEQNKKGMFLGISV